MRKKLILQSAMAVTLLVSALGGRAAAQSRADTVPSRDAAVALEQEGREGEAEAAWMRRLTADPADAEAYAHVGFLESRQEHYEKAVFYYRKALALKPSMPGLKMNLGLALFKSGDMKGAAVTFESLYRGEPAASAEAQRLRILSGMARYGAGDYGATIRWLKDAMARDPQNLPYRLVLAQSCLRARQFQCVLDVDREILNLNPDSAEADMLTGEALDEMRDHNGALQQFRAAVKADPKFPGVHFALGYLLWTQSQYAEAAREFQAELEINANDVQSLAYLADSNMRLGNVDAARKGMQRVLQLDPHMAMGYVDLGMMDADAGNRDQALKELKMAAALNPKDVQIHWRLGRLYQAMGRKDEAKAEFELTKTLTRTQDETVFKKLHHEGADGQESMAQPGVEVKAASHSD